MRQDNDGYGETGLSMLMCVLCDMFQRDFNACMFCVDLKGSKHEENETISHFI